MMTATQQAISALETIVTGLEENRDEIQALCSTLPSDHPVVEIMNYIGIAGNAALDDMRVEALRCES